MSLGYEMETNKFFFIICLSKKESPHYIIETKVNNGCVDNSGEDTLIELFHQKLKHISEKKL